jgi:hypothetical protein
MKHAKMAAASSFAICLVLLLAGPAAAQNASENQGGYPGAMPADHSTPEERAATAALNRQISDANRAADAQAALYVEERARYRDAMQRNRLQQRDYRARRAAYEALRAHYASERAAYRRHDWPDRHRWMRLGDDVDPLGLQLLLVDGAPAGKVVDAVHAPDGQIEALQVDLFGGAQVWLDASDVRYDRSERALMTNLDRRDLSEMAAEHL